MTRSSCSHRTLCCKEVIDTKNHSKGNVSHCKSFEGNVCDQQSCDGCVCHHRLFEGYVFHHRLGNVFHHRLFEGNVCHHRLGDVSSHRWFERSFIHHRSFAEGYLFTEIVTSSIQRPEPEWLFFDSSWYYWHHAWQPAKETQDSVNLRRAREKLM